METFQLKYGGVNLKLRKSTHTVGIETMTNHEQFDTIDTGMKLSTFSLMDLSKTDENLEDGLAKLRANPSVSIGTHVYYSSDDEIPFVPTGDIYIQFDDNAALEDCQAALDEHCLEIKKVYAEKEFTVRVTKESRNPVYVSRQLQTLAIIKIAEPDFSIPGQLFSEFTLPSDKLLKSQWHLENTGFHRGTSLNLKAGADARVVKAWRQMQSLGDPAIIVAIIDDGFDLEHPDLSGNGKVVGGWNFSNNTSDPSPNHYKEKHGTPCAGVAVGAANQMGIVGAAPNCKLMPIKWGQGLTDEAIEAWFGYVQNSGAAVLSCSWGAKAKSFPLSHKKRKAIANCAKYGRNGKGTVICFAAGNDNQNINQPGYYHKGFANHPAVIAVSAINSRDQKSHYSNYGHNISVCAPSNGSGGMGILTADVTEVFYRGHPTHYRGYSRGSFTNSFGGTSSACPLVAGICALILSIRPDLRAGQVKQLIEYTARKVGPDESYDSNGHSIYYGYGCVDAEAAIKYLMDQKHPI